MIAPIKMDHKVPGGHATFKRTRAAEKTYGAYRVSLKRYSIRKAVRILIIDNYSIVYIAIVIMIKSDSNQLNLHFLKKTLEL